MEYSDTLNLHKWQATLTKNEYQKERRLKLGRRLISV